MRDGWRKGFLPHRGLWALSALLVLASAWATPRLRRASEGARVGYGARRTTSEALRERNESAFAQILGEVRATSADLMFVKTGRYLHGGIAYAPRLKIDSANEAKRYAGCDDETPTLIRTAAEDFRGFLGRLERAVKPFPQEDNEHAHFKERELVPWYRLMTMANPKFVRGYRVGAVTLRDEGLWEKGLAFLEEGVANNEGNPELFLIYQTIAAYHLGGRFAEAYPWGEAWADKALAAANSAFALGVAQRPAGGKPGDGPLGLAWTSDLEEDFLFSAHLITLILREQGRLDEALVSAQRLVRLVPDNKSFAVTLGRIQTQITEREDKETKAR